MNSIPSTESVVLLPKPAGVSPAKSRNSLIFWGLVVSGTLIDLLSKASVFNSLGFPGRVSDWTQTYLNGWVQFRFLTSFNEGALWGFGQGFTMIFALLSLFAGVAILVWMFWFRGSSSLWLSITLGFVLAGTLGNLYDRLGLHGYEVSGRQIYAVRDFLAFTFGEYHYPIFNFADVFLVTGAIMLGVYSFTIESPPAAKAKKTTPEPALPASEERIA